MKRRKHRLVVELTLSHPVTEREARQALSLLLDRWSSNNSRLVWLTHYAQKLEVKEFSRVHRAQVFKDREAAAQITFGKASLLFKGASRT